MNILIANSHAARRQQLKHDVSERVPDGLIFEATSGHEVLQLVVTEPFAIVILDIRLPHEGCVPVLRRLKQRMPALPVMMLDAYPDQYYSIASRKADAAGFLSQYVSPDVLGATMRTILNGGVFFLPDSRQYETGSG